MIKYIGKDTESLSFLKDICDICAVRIMALAECYGGYDDIISVWVQYDGGDKPVGAVSKYGGDMTVWISQEGDIPELRDFLSFTGGSSVLSNERLYDAQERAVVMKREGNMQEEAFSYKEEELASAYELIKNAAERALRLRITATLCLIFSTGFAAEGQCLLLDMKEKILLPLQ